MKKHLCTMAAVLLCLLLFGCAAGDLSRYPYVSQKNDATHIRLTVAVPQEEWMMALCGQMSELLSERSDGTVSLLLTPAEDPMELYRSGKADLAFCTTAQIMETAPELEWLVQPFLFADPETYLACMNAEESPVRQSQTIREELDGSVLGVWYDCGWMLASGEEGAAAADPLAEMLFGVDFRYNGREMILALGARDTAFGNAKKLWQLLSQGETGTVEFRPDETQSLPENTAAITVSRHRMEGRFLILRQGVVPEETLLYLEQTVSETLGQACRQRMEQEESTMQSQSTASGAALRTEPLRELSTRAAVAYGSGDERYGLDAETLKFIRPYLVQ